MPIDIDAALLLAGIASAAREEHSIPAGQTTPGGDDA